MYCNCHDNVHIFSCPRASAQTLLSICSRSKVYLATRSTDRVCWHIVGPSVGPWGRWKSEGFQLTICLITLSEGLISWDCGPVCVLKSREPHTGENSNHQSDISDWPIAWPTVKSPFLFCCDAPFWLILTDWFCFALLFSKLCHLWTSRQLGSYLILFSKDSYCKPDKTPQSDRRQSTIHPQDPG